MQKEIESSIEVIKSGGVIAYPTDTIWGLGCDPTDEKAVQKIIEVKERPASKSFVIIVASIEQLYKYFKDLPEMAYELIELTETPLTLVLDDAKNLAKSVIAEDGSVAVRVVKSGFAHELCKKLKSGLVSTSINKSGQPAAKTFADIPSDILASLDYTVNLPAEKGTGKASSIIRLKADGQVQVLRS